MLGKFVLFWSRRRKPPLLPCVTWQPSTGRSHRDWGKTFRHRSAPSGFKRAVYEDTGQVSDGFTGFLPAAQQLFTFFSRRRSECSLPRGWRLASGTAAKHGGLQARGRSLGLRGFGGYLPWSGSRVKPRHSGHLTGLFLAFSRVCGRRREAASLFTLQPTSSRAAPLVCGGPWIIVLYFRSCHQTDSKVFLN